MKKISYVGNAGSACALACYTMAAQYLLPKKDITFEKLAELTDWKKDYVVWGFRVWKYLMDLGIHIVDYDTIDYDAWSKNGVDGLKKSVPPQDFEYYKKNTYSIEDEAKYIKGALGHENFTYVRRKPTWDDVFREFAKPGVIDLTLDLSKLNNSKEFEAHRVVIVDISDKEVVFNDPDNNWQGENRAEPLTDFRQLFEAMDAPELARYYL